jgi:hypothetical protein
MVRCILLVALQLTAIAQESTKSVPNSEVRQKITWAPAQSPTFSPKKEWTKPKVMVTSLRADGLMVQLEQTDIRETAKRYQAELGHQGDAADFTQWLCFLGGSKGERWALWLLSGEIDGDRVSDFSIKRIGSDAVVDSRCKPLGPDSEAPTTFPSKVRLGMSESDLRLALGEPTARRGNFIYYAHSHDFKGRNEPYTLMNTVTVEVKDGVVIWVMVWKSTQS